MSGEDVKRNGVIRGDTIKEMRRLPGESIDLIFADPPYWMRTDGVLHRVEGTEYHDCNDEWDQFTTLQEYERFTEAWC